MAFAAQPGAKLSAHLERPRRPVRLPALVFSSVARVLSTVTLLFTFVAQLFTMVAQVLAVVASTLIMVTTKATFVRRLALLVLLSRGFFTLLQPRFLRTATNASWHKTICILTVRPAGHACGGEW